MVTFKGIIVENREINWVKVIIIVNNSKVIVK